ncbi:MAG: nickel-responsive transcriptional regulator NikR [Candidatus Margulisiibacteriota bacterium]|jgi:CopG family nickel-responsive transcriptional regulator
MKKLTRFGVSIENELLKEFDQYLADKCYENRSEAIRDLIRDALTRQAHKNIKTVALGTISLVYDHHSNGLAQRLMDVQHDYHDHITATVHVHIDHHNCLEIIVVKGQIAKLQALADRLISVKGVKSGKLCLTI